MTRRVNRCVEVESYREQREGLLRMLSEELPSMYRLPDYFRLFIDDEETAEMVYVYSLPLFQIPSGNGKSAPAFQILLEEEAKGNLKGRTAFVASSGNTAANMVLIAPWFDCEVVPVVDATIPDGKKGQLKFAGGSRIEIPPFKVSTIDWAEKLGQEPNCMALNQYEHSGSVRAHKRWTWPHVRNEMRRVGHDPSIVSLALGTTSSFVAAECLKNTRSNLNLAGIACVSEAEKIPGARTKEGLKVTKFGYEKVLYEQNLPFDPFVTCGRQHAEEMMRELFRHQFSAGPTTGMAISGAFQLINRAHKDGGKRAIEKLRNNEGEIVIVTLAMDQAAPYFADYAE